MATTPKILLKKSSVAGRVPQPGDLDYGELAINFEDGKTYNIPSDLWSHLKTHGNIYDTL